MTNSKRVEEEETISDYEKFYLTSQNYAHKITIDKTKTSILIKCKKYEII